MTIRAVLYGTESVLAQLGKGSRSRRGAVAAIMLAAAMATPIASAQTTFTNGNNSAAWNDAANWSAGVPVAGSQAILGVPTNPTGTITLNTGSLAGSLQFSNGYTLNSGDLTLDLAGGNITVDPALTGTINSNLFGTVGLTVNPLASSGTGTLVLGGTNTFTGTVAVSAGTLRFGADANLGAAANALTLGTATTSGTLDFTGSTATISRSITLGTNTTGGGVINVGTAGQTLTLSGVISGGTANSAAQGTLGNTGLSITGGRVVLGGANTFTGNIVIDGSAAVLQVDGTDSRLGATAAASWKSVILSNGGTYNQTAGTYNPTDGSGANTANKRFLIGTGGGTIDLASGATLQLDDGGQFSGSAALTKAGAGTLVIDNQAYNFTGAINITGGILRVPRNAGVLGTSAAVTAPISISSGATYDIQVTQTSARPITMAGGATLVNENAATAASVTSVALTGNPSLGGAGNVTISSLDGGGAARTFTKSGGGVLAITAGTNFTGTSVVTVPSGGLLLGANNVLGTAATITATGTLTEIGQTGAALPGYSYSVAADGVLAGDAAFFNSLTVGGNLNQVPSLTAQTAAGGNNAAAAKFGFANNASRFFGVAMTTADNVTVGTGTPWAGISNDNSIGRTYTGTITANSDFTVRATNGKSFTMGTVTLTPGSPRTVTLTGGTILFSSATSNYNNNVTIAVANGATLQATTNTAFGTSTTAASNATINVLSGGAFNPNGGVTVNNIVNIQPGGILNIDDATNLAGTGTYVQVPGSITRITNNGGNALAGAMSPGTVPGSIVRLQTDNIGSMTTKLSSGAIYELFAGNRLLPAGTSLALNSTGFVTIGSFTNVPTGVVTNDGTSRALNTTNATTAAAISIGSGGATFVSTDGTTLTVAGTGANPSAGSLSILGGSNTINIGVANPVMIDGFWKGGANGSVVYGGPTDNTTTPTTGFRAGAINILSGTFTHNGGGAPLQLSGNGTFNSGTGTGLLTANSNTAFVNNTGILIDAQLNILFNGAARFVAGATDNAVASQSISGLQGAGTITLGNNTTGTNRDVQLTLGINGVSSTFAGVIADADGTRNGGLTKVGTGTLTLSGNNTYTLGTTISAGAVQLGSGGATGTVAGNITNNAALIVDRSNNFTMTGIISGTGTVTKNGAGVLTLSVAPTYTGGTTINGGGITLAAGTTFASSSLTVGNAGRFSYIPATAGTLSLGAAPMNLASTAQLGLNFGSTIATTGTATTAAGGSVGFVLSGTPAAQSYTLLTAGSGLSTTDYTVLNPTNFTYTLSKTDTAVSITTTPATALTTAYWKGGFSGNSWAASDGSTQSNFTTDAPGTIDTPLTPGSGTTVRFSGATATNKTSQTLGTNIAVAGLINDDTAPIGIADTANALIIGTGGISQNAAVGAAGGLTLGSHVVLGGNQTWTNNSGSTLTIGGSGLSVTGNANTLTIAGSGNTSVAATVTTSGAVTVSANGNVTIGGDLVAPATSLTKTGTGTLTLNGTNNTLLTLNMNSASTLDIGSGFLTISNVGGNTIQSSLASGTAFINATGGGAIVLNRNNTDGPDNGVANGGTLQINARVTGISTFEFFRTGVTTGVIYLANNANDFTGSIILNAGVIRTDTIGNANLPSGIGSNGTILLGTNANAGTLRYTGTGEVSDKILALNATTGSPTIDMSGTGLLRFTSNLTAGGAGIKTLTLTGSTTGIGELAGSIPNNSGTNTTSLVKNGTGTWVLSGANTYTATTTVNAGTLLINGSVTSSVTLPAAAAASTTLGGSGSIAGAVVVNVGRLSPGNSPGVLTVTGAVTLGSATTSATYAVELGGATPGNGSTNYDQLISGGATTITAATLDAVLYNGFVPSTSDVFFIAARGDAGAHTTFFTGLPEGGTYTFVDGSTAQITYAANWTGNQATSTLSGGNDIALYNVVAVPEPGSVAVLAMGAGLLVGRRRRRH